MKILVIFTGGTIGSVISSDSIFVSEVTKYTLINDYLAKFGAEAIFETQTPFYVLSENLSAAEINALVDCVNENAKKDYDGIIITHGTDTLGYSAAALSYMIENTDIPIMLVSSNLPLEVPNSNGRINFEAAVSFIKDKSGKGVFACYKNTDEESVQIHYGIRLISSGELCDNNYSIKNEPYAFYNGEKIILNERCKKITSVSPYKNVFLCDYPDILVVNARPGDNFNYNIEKFSSVIMIPYHSGTLNTSNIAFKDFCNRAKKLDIPIFIVNLREGFDYESKKLFDDLSLIQLPLCTFIAIYVKIWIGESMKIPLAEFVKRQSAGEFYN